MEPFEPLTLGGIGIEHWWEAWTHCSGAQGQHSWPAGGAYAEQDNLTVMVFALIAQEQAVWLKQQSKRR